MSYVAAYLHYPDCDNEEAALKQLGAEINEDDLDSILVTGELVRPNQHGLPVSIVGLIHGVDPEILEAGMGSIVLFHQLTVKQFMELRAKVLGNTGTPLR